MPESVTRRMATSLVPNTCSAHRRGAGSGVGLGLDDRVGRHGRRKWQGELTPVDVALIVAIGGKGHTIGQ